MIHQLHPSNDLEDALAAAELRYETAHNRWRQDRSREASYEMDEAKAEAEEIRRQLRYLGVRV